MDCQACAGTQAVPDIRFPLEEEQQSEDEDPEFEVVVGHCFTFTMTSGIATIKDFDDVGPQNGNGAIWTNPVFNTHGIEDTGLGLSESSVSQCLDFFLGKEGVSGHRTQLDSIS